MAGIDEIGGIGSKPVAGQGAAAVLGSIAESSGGQGAQQASPSGALDGLQGEQSGSCSCCGQGGGCSCGGGCCSGGCCGAASEGANRAQEL